MFKSVLLILFWLTFLLFGNIKAQERVTIIFIEYNVEINFIKKLGDTLQHNKSSKEDFKFVFFDTKGKCYCERYIYGKLYEKGFYENSLDTLKQYVSGRYPGGVSGPISVLKYFEPLKNGEWLTYKDGKVSKKENYLMGIKQRAP